MKKIVGIVAEYNPFHNGHKYQIDKIKEKYNDSIIIACVTSSFTQRGDISIINKFDKTKILLDNNIDLVVELPYIYSTQSSDIFASYAVDILNELKIDTLCFGCETDNIEEIKLSARTQINNEEFNSLVKKHMDEGINYPSALNKSLKELINIEISNPNDLLALSYLKRIYEKNYNIDIYNIKRTNNYHDLNSNDEIISANNIREKIKNNINIKKYVPETTYNFITKKDNKYFDYLKYKIISEENLNKFVDVDEGLNTRIKEAINKSENLEELIQNIKTKRYTYNRISRMLNHILCSFTKEENDIKNLEYIRILGFSKKGQNYLNKIKKDLNIPILNKYDTKKYKTLKIEKRITDIYSIVYDDISKEEIKNNPIKKEQ